MNRRWTHSASTVPMKGTKLVTQAEQLAPFIVKRSYDDMSEIARKDLRIRFWILLVAQSGL